MFVSGIGCSSRFPYYMNTYGMHSIHGRAPAIATGVAVARPDLDVWVITGDGDGLSIGGNHLIHALRRNVNLTILLFNNRIYGLTKGQYSPTSELGKVTKSTPMGSIDPPFNPLAVALGAEASFVARTHDLDRKHMMETFRAAHDHRGASFVEIYQNCNVFNDGQFNDITKKQARDEMMIDLVHGEPIRFGADRQRGVVMGARRSAAPRRGRRRRRGRAPRPRRPPRRPEPGVRPRPAEHRRPLADAVRRLPRRRAPGVRLGDRRPARPGIRTQGPRRPRRPAALERHLDGRRLELRGTPSGARSVTPCRSATATSRSTSPRTATPRRHRSSCSTASRRRWTRGSGSSRHSPSGSASCGSTSAVMAGPTGHLGRTRPAATSAMPSPPSAGRRHAVPGDRPLARRGDRRWH